MNQIRNKLTQVMLCCFITGITFSQTFTSIEEEKKSEFSYMANAVEQLGFKDAPEAMSVTNGGTFSSSFMAVEFLYGNNLQLVKERVVLLKSGYLPIIEFNFNDNGINYALEAFSAPLNMNPQNNLVTYVKWTVTNNSNQQKTAKLGFRIKQLLNAPKNKTFIKHNMYCTPWYQNKYMDYEDYKANLQLYDYNSGMARLSNHFVVQYPTGFSAQGDNIQGTAISLKPNESHEFIFKMPYVPTTTKHNTVIETIKTNRYNTVKGKIIAFWNTEMEALNVFSFPEKKVMDAYKASYAYLLTARDILEDGEGFIQKCNEFQYDYFYVRDNAYFARVYDMLGLHKESRVVIEPYFIKDIEGNDIHFRQRTGIYNKFCHDYWGQVLWALGSYYRQNKDTDLLKRAYKLLDNHILDFKNQVALDDRGLWPKTWPYDNEHIDGHYTGHSFWVILGLRYAVYMANAMEDTKKVEEWTKLYNDYSENFKKELKTLTDKSGGYIPPGMDKVEDGYDWANASAGLYPFEAIDKTNPAVATTLKTVRTYNYMEGVATYSGCNAYVAKDSILNNKELPFRGIHHYETFYVTNGNLVMGNQKEVVEDLYAVLAHTTSTHAGFEWRATPWVNRDSEHNRQPHGWMSARYIELLRNMLVREEGNDIHLLSAISPEWIQEGKNIKVNQAPTYFGNISYSLKSEKKAFNVDFNFNWNNDKVDNVYFHIPWFLNVKAIYVDGKSVKVSKVIILPKQAKHIKVVWNDREASQLNFNKAVDIFLNKFYNKPANANYAHLFPTLVAPGFEINNKEKTVKLFSLDNYGTVYYTTNGSTPNKNSKLYKLPIKTDTIKVIKAVTVSKDGKTSDVKIINIDN
ncbi:MAG: chitobiase/beta-hexosaminidase C-terminal domain-containing protein [Aestuariibaculum sp.]